MWNKLHGKASGMQSVGVWKNIPLQTELIMRSHNESLIRFLGVMVNEAGCFLANLAAFYCIYCCSAALQETQEWFLSSKVKKLSD